MTAALLRDQAPTVDLRDYEIVLVSTSAGKDSAAMLDVVADLAADARVLDRVTVLHCNLGEVEWPGTAQLARKQAARYRLRYEERRAPDLLDLVRRRGMWPSAQARYCTSALKRQVARKVITELVGELGPRTRPARVLSCMGHRAQESRSRAAASPLRRDQAASSGRRHIDVWLPIHQYTIEDVWRRIHTQQIPYHDAYRSGMTRLSCSICILGSRADLIRGAQLRPELAATYADVERDIGHQFRRDISMREIIAAAQTRPAPAPTDHTHLALPLPCTAHRHTRAATPRAHR